MVVLLGNADGTFPYEKAANVGGYGITQIVVGDFNSDGKADLAFLQHDVRSFTNSVRILLGGGNGYFTQGPSTVVADYLGAQALVFGDFNGDGIPDLAVTFNSHGQGYYSIYLGRGDGRLQATDVGRLPVQADGQAVVGDFNSDGILDIAVLVENGVNPINLLLGRGDGRFVSKAVPSPCREPAPGGGLVTADFTGDGPLDLLPEFCRSTIMLGNGDATFRTLQTTSSFGQVHDVNGDGIPDLIAKVYEYGLQVSLGSGDGTFTPVADGDFPFPFAPGPFGVGDFNGDGVMDLISSRTVNEAICYLSCGVPATSMELWFGSTPVVPVPAATNSIVPAGGSH